jgi:alkylation response protein AidB-like acyl-CoA dehydrogenase
MSEMRSDLLQTIDRVFDEHCPKPVRESAEAGAWPAALWRALEEVGLDRAALAEDAGGSGLEFEDAMLALRRGAITRRQYPWRRPCSADGCLLPRVSRCRTAR